ncbi:SDR family oxidoreductase [candidate division KSB1 bacterium]|nr:SDR family oxidoreductase [candidate division KSB1 bacterium]
MKKSIWHDKIIFITGGSSGIGLAVARAFCLEGAHVAIFARRLPQLTLAAQELTNLKQNVNQRIQYEQLDVADEAAVQNIFNRTIEEIGAPDVLINCAGRAIPNYIDNISTEQFDETIRVNLKGVWNTVKAVLPAMKQYCRGYIVNTSSIIGFMGVFGYADYCASKFAIIGLSEGLRSELKRDNIHISVLCPPDTDTPGFAIENQTKPPETRAVSEMAKLTSPDKVARSLLIGMKRKKFMIIPGFDGKLTWIAKRYAPGLVDRMIENQISKAIRKQ